MRNFNVAKRLTREEVSPSLEETGKKTVPRVREYLPDLRWSSNVLIPMPWDRD